MDLDYSPTGKEFVTGSYDKTIRIFPIDSGRSREAYHGKRLQKYFTNKIGFFLFSGPWILNICYQDLMI